MALGLGASLQGTAATPSVKIGLKAAFAPGPYLLELMYGQIS